MTLKLENTKSMTDSRKEINQIELRMNILKRILEVSSVICSTVSITMVIACAYGDIPNILGFKSEMIFNMAFSLLVASIILGIFAMATSRIQNIQLQVSFPVLRILTIFSSLLTTLCFKNKNLEGCQEFPKPANVHPIVNNMECINNLKVKRGNQEYLKCVDNLSEDNRKLAECSLKNSEQNTAFFQYCNISSEIKCPPQKQKCQNPFLLGNCCVTQSPTHCTKSLKFKQYELGQMEKKSLLEPLVQQTFITNGHFNEVNTRNISEKCPQVGIISPFKVNNSSDAEYCDLYKNLSPSVETIHTLQKCPKPMFNASSIQQSQNTCRNLNVCFQDNSILHDNKLSIRTVSKFPNRQVYPNKFHTTNLQNLHEVQNKFHNGRCHGSHEVPHTQLLQTIPESSDQLFYNRSGIPKFNFHKTQNVDYEDHSFNFHQKVTPYFKKFQQPLIDFKEVSYSQIGIINTHHGENKKSEIWDQNIIEKSEIPMEICDKAPNDQILEVSMKLNDLNFLF